MDKIKDSGSFALGSIPSGLTYLKQTFKTIKNEKTKYHPTVQSVIPDEDDIDVILSDFTKIEFRLNYEWKKVDCEHATTYTSVPATLVPEQITTYVTSNFPNTLIKKLEKKHFGWEIELNNGLEVNFNNNFNVTKIDD